LNEHITPKNIFTVLDETKSNTPINAQSPQLNASFLGMRKGTFENVLNFGTANNQILVHR